MKYRSVKVGLSLIAVVGSLVLAGMAQQGVATAASAAVPPLIQFSNVATDEGGNSLSGVVSITFSLYSSQQGGEPLWTETQNNVQLDPTGHYSVQLGITRQNGVPTTLFTTGEARWLGVQITEQGEQPRVLLLSVPYALKAGDAATIGGLPPSAFVLAAPGTASAASAPTTFIASTASSGDAPTATDVTGSGTADFIPLWTSTSNIADSVLVQSGTGATAKVGIGTTTPATTLDVKGSGTIRGTLSLPATGTATATAGTNSQALSLAASAFNSSTTAAANQTFFWLAQPADNDTATPSGTLNLLFAEGTGAPAQTGLHIANNGQITFATGQTFPGTGNGTLTGVTTATASGLTGGGTSGTLKLGLTSACTAKQVLQYSGTAWACASAGTVTSVGSGAGLAGGPITGGGTLSIANAGVTNTMLQNSNLTLNASTAGGLTVPGSMTLGSTYTIGLKTCSSNQVLQYNGTTWACASVGTGTVTSVGSGAGLTGGPITGTGSLSIATAGVSNAMLANPSLTISPGTALTGGGAVSLGGSTTLSLDTTKVPLLAAANTFSTNQTVNGTLTAASFSGNGSALTNITATNSSELGGLASGAYAQLAAANTFSNGQTVNGTLTVTSGGYSIVGNTSGAGYAAVEGFGASEGVIGSATSTSGFGIYGTSPGVGVFGTGSIGVDGVTESSSGDGVYGAADATTGNTVGVFGYGLSASGYGVYGSSPNIGVYGTGDISVEGGGGIYGVYGAGANTGVYGASAGQSQTGEDFGGAAGVWGDTGGAGYVGVLGTTDNNYAGSFLSNGPSNLYVRNFTQAVAAEALTAYMDSVKTYAIIGDPGCNTGFIAIQLGQDGMGGCNNYTLVGGIDGNTGVVGSTYLNANSGQTLHLRVGNVDQMTVTSGNVDVLGTLSKGGGSFKIDDPLDPANKYLYHSFVESPDMKNMYDGNITTDDAGLATVTLPDWFETLNRDFRYQLTVIGQFAQAIVASEIRGNQFGIRTDKPNVKVSWQVTGTRQDAFANAHRIQVEVEKAPADRGHYLYPELVGAPETARIGYMAPAPGSEQIVHPRPTMQKRGNASPLQQRTSPSIPVPPMPVAPKVAPLPHPAAQASKPEVNQK
jgi:hypothetical protein